MQKVLHIVLVTLLWVMVVAYMVYAAALARTDREKGRVRSMRIALLDSTDRGTLIAEREIFELFARHDLKTVDEPLSQLDMQQIEQVIARNGFVADVKAYLTGDDILHIDLRQRSPILRLRLNGMDSYVSREGYLFPAPPRSALYVPVLTGDYRPIVGANFHGSLREEVDRRQGEIDSVIRLLEREKYPHYLAEKQNDRRLDSVYRHRIKRHGFLINREKDEEFELRVKETRAEKAVARRHLRYIGRQIQGRIDRLSDRQEALRTDQKKLEKNYEDFMKLLTFVEQVENDAFWRSELVELVLTQTPSGALDLSLIPRSGRFTIRIGRLEEIDYKLEKLERFYRKGLPALGWDRYREVDVRFSDRVVCR